jgi:hypothetical protein
MTKPLLVSAVALLGALATNAFGQAPGDSPSHTLDMVLKPQERGEAILAVETITREQSQTAFTASGVSSAVTTKPGLVLALKVGHEDIHTYVCTQLDMPPALLDADGGTIRIIMQHELDPNDQVRVIHEHIGVEYTDDSYGKRGRYVGRYGWTRQGGGGDHSWVLGDQVAHNLFAPWGWIWADDFARFGNNQILGGNKIQICVHPHVTARVFFYD